MNVVEEESRRANENARNGRVRSEEVTKESDKEDEEQVRNGRKSAAIMAASKAQFRHGYAKTHLA